MPNFSGSSNAGIAIRFLALSLCFISCRETTAPIDMKTMSRVLVKMHLAESYTQFLPKGPGQTELRNPDSLARFNKMVLNEFKISEEDLTKSLEYYKTHPAHMDSIYQMVLADIAILQANQNK